MKKFVIAALIGVAVVYWFLYQVGKEMYHYYR